MMKAATESPRRRGKIFIADTVAADAEAETPGPKFLRKHFENRIKPLAPGYGIAYDSDGIHRRVPLETELKKPSMWSIESCLVGMENQTRSHCTERIAGRRMTASFRILRLLGQGRFTERTAGR